MLVEPFIPSTLTASIKLKMLGMFFCARQLLTLAELLKTFVRREILLFDYLMIKS